VGLLDTWLAEVVVGDAGNVSLTDVANEPVSVAADVVVAPHRTEQVGGGCMSFCSAEQAKTLGKLNRDKAKIVLTAISRFRPRSSHRGSTAVAHWMR
jgi:hypothetical protein